MQVEYTGRQVTISSNFRTLAEEGVERVAKLFPRITSVHVILSAEKYRQTAEVTIKTRLHEFLGISESTSMETALREALDKAETQAIKCKKKLEAKKRTPKAEKIVAETQLQRPARKAAKLMPRPVEDLDEVPAVVNGNGSRNGSGRRAASVTVPVTVHTFPSRTPILEPHIVRSTDGVALRPMTLEEAVKEAEFRDREVFVFRDSKGHVKVLHRKRDGKMELIEEP
ncbi:ribosome hibernation-promoting factor, HPF/YfiA family [Silvibacterium sp.]|uniref:ribosome hibernation-promoting factor, HPF/YfiA family n=1 Tax=Silvibacterium sp. TaxID=1964179 RepID=UPI0039E223A4